MKAPTLPNPAISELGRNLRSQRGIGTTLRPSLLSLLLLFSATTAFAENWTFLYRAADLEVFSNGASPPTLKAQGVLAVDVVDIIAILSDVPRRTEWVRNLRESRIILDNQADHVLIYSRYHLPWPANDRDSLIETKYTKDYKNGEITIRFNAIEVAGEPPRKDAIRIPTVDGVLHLKILDEGKTFVRYEVKLDPGGWLPQWICNFFVRDAPMEMLQAMKRRIVEKKELYKDFTDAQMRLWHVNLRK